MKKTILSILLTFVLVAALLPSMAFGSQDGGIAEHTGLSHPVAGQARNDSPGRNDSSVLNDDAGQGEEVSVVSADQEPESLPTDTEGTEAIPAADPAEPGTSGDTDTVGTEAGDVEPVSGDEDTAYTDDADPDAAAPVGTDTPAAGESSEASHESVTPIQVVPEVSGHSSSFSGIAPLADGDADWVRLRQVINNQSAPSIITIYPRGAEGVTEDLAKGILVLRDEDDFINSDGMYINVPRSVTLRSGSAGSGKNPGVIKLRTPAGVTYAALPTSDPTDGAGRHFSIRGGGTINFAFENIVIDGTGHRGGVFIQNTSVTMSGARIENCASWYYGGGVHVKISDDKVSGSASFDFNGSILSCKSSGSGGGIYAQRCHVTLKGDIHDCGAEFSGGGIHIFGGHLNLESGSNVEYCSAMEGAGIRIAQDTGILSKVTIKEGADVYANKAKNFGGGLYADQGVSIVLDGGRIAENSADKYNGGGIHMLGDAKNPGTGILINSGDIYNNTAKAYGGGIYSSSTVTMKGGTVSKNNALAGGGICLTNDPNNPYSSISKNNPAVLTQTGGVITENTGAYYGGGVYLSASTAYELSDGGTVSKNDTSYYGGGIFLSDNSKFTMEGGTVSGNNGYLGGGLFLQAVSAGKLAINGGTVSGNKATGAGGGIYTQIYSLVTVAAPTVFSGNTAGGGGYWLEEISNGNTAYEALIAAHTANILTATRSATPDGSSDTSFDYLYNNYDINFEYQRHTVTFVSNADGVSVPQQVVPHDQKAAAPTGSERVGYSLDGWYRNSDLTGVWDFGTDKVSDDITLYAKWTAKEYTISYDMNGATSAPALDQTGVKWGDAVLLPADPTMIGYVFSGWNVSDGGNGRTGVSASDTYGDLAANDIAPGITLQAQWTVTMDNTLTFDANGGKAGSLAVLTGLEYDRTLIAQGHELPVTAAGTAPVRTGYVLQGWAETPNAGTPDFNAAAVVKWVGNKTVYAVWTPDDVNYRVEHYLVRGDGSVVTLADALSYKGKTGSAVTAVPGTYTGYDYKAGYANGTHAEVLSGTVSADGLLVLKVYYEVKTFKVTFADWNGLVLKEQAVEYGDDAAPPQDPSRSGHTFTGWNGKYTNVTSDITVTAVYNKNPAPPVTPPPAKPDVFTVTFVNWDGTVLKTEQVVRGGSATAPRNPVRKGYTFTGWNAGYTNVQSDIVVRALYRAVPVLPAPTAQATVTVTFVDHDGTILKSQDVPVGGDASPPADPVREGYSFYKWVGSYTGVASDVTITAQYVRDEISGNDLMAGAGENGNGSEDVIDSLKTEHVPTLTIDGLEVPVTAGSFGNLTWALVNLILVLAGIALVVIGVLRTRMTRRPDGEDTETTYRGRKIVLRVALVALAVIGAVVFVLTENMSLLMVLTDSWTIVNAVILALEIVVFLFAFGKEKNREEDEKHMNAVFAK